MVNSLPLIQSFWASATVSKHMSLQSAHETRVAGSEGSAMGRAEGLSFR